MVASSDVLSLVVFDANQRRKVVWWSKTRYKLKRALLLPVLLLGVEPAHAVVAGGMVSTTRTWPETANGYDDMAWFIQIVKEPGFNGRTFWASTGSQTEMADIWGCRRETETTNISISRCRMPSGG